MVLRECGLPSAVNTVGPVTYIVTGITPSCTAIKIWGLMFNAKDGFIATSESSLLFLVVVKLFLFVLVVVWQFSYN